MQRCERCGLKVRGEVWGTPTGQRVCRGCHDTVVGALIGFGSGGGVGGAYTGPAILQWIRGSLRRRPRT